MALCIEERLRGKRLFENLFKNGQSFVQPPYRVVWLILTDAGLYPSRFAVSVPKRRFKRAVKRNLLKRRTREVFFANKQILNSAVKEDEQIHLTVIYNSDELLPSTDLDAAMKKVLQHIVKKYAESV